MLSKHVAVRLAKHTWQFTSFLGKENHFYHGFLNHYDNHGHKTGHSDRAIFSGVNHYDEKGHKTGHSDCAFFGGVNHYGDDDE